MGRLVSQSKIIAALLVLLAWGMLALAQDGAVFRTDVRLVRMLVTVKNGAGELISGLDKRDFAITDDEVQQEITAFERETSKPLSVALLLDASWSAKKDFGLVLESARGFLGGLIQEGNSEDTASLYSFNADVSQHTNYTRRLARLEDSLKGLATEAGTSLYDAIYLSSRQLEERDGRHVMVLVTDGTDTTSKKKYPDAVAAAQRAEAVVYPIVIVPISNPVGRNVGGEHALETMAESTGGRVFYATVGKQLDTTFAQILRDLRTQYLISYAPRGVVSNDGHYHRVQVKLTQRPELRISTRSGYYGDSRR